MHSCTRLLFSDTFYKNDLPARIYGPSLVHFVSLIHRSELRKAYYKKAIKYHPDTNQDDPSAADKFSRLAEAYDLIQDHMVRRVVGVDFWPQHLSDMQRAMFLRVHIPPVTSPLYLLSRATQPASQPDRQPDR